MAGLLLMIPGPTEIDERVIRAMARQMIDHRSDEFRALMKSVVEKSRKIFEANSSDIYILTASGTGGVEAAASNLTQPGDKVLILSAGLFAERMAEAFAAYGANVVKHPLENGQGPNPVAVKKLLETHPDTAIVGFPFNETSTGIISRDVKEIGRICREHGALLVVDAVTAVGGVRVPVDEYNIDVCVAGTQKCLATPPGLALVTVSKRAWEKIEQKKLRPPYFDLVKYRHFMERWETPFTPAVTLFWAFDEALNIIFEYGYERWLARHAAGAAGLYAGLRTYGLEFYAGPGFESPIVAAMHIPPGLTDTAIRETMKKKYGILISGGLAHYKGKMFRIANIGLITRDKVVNTIFALGKTLKSLGMDVDVSAAVENTERELDRNWPS
ncbi:MAG: alanine--glyoxylate aminotransferase family protein [Candidatus Caldarchaeum sp.]|uniref:Alanine--glyoxylate aminotransferase family protein n=1 Tax=Caldiarchaeum subterraneum TaxID=311458 RepID=A0A7J3G465_CALS0|nr:alanine--glyoxylate aminotransferase family protein [Candidatus Caldarchaeales archaeon]